MAELFDERRQESVVTRRPPFDASVQLPLVGELDRPDRMSFLMGLLGDLLLPFPHLSDDAVKTELEETTRYKDALRVLHLRVLDDLADEQEQLNAYQLGLALSDLCWLPAKNGGPGAFIEVFGRAQVAGLQALLNGAGAAIPPDTATVVGRSLENWQDWIDVNAAKLKQDPATAWDHDTNPMLRTLRIQGMAWHSVLTADPDVSAQPVLRAWAYAAAGIARAARLVTFTILRRFWPLAMIVVAALALLLYLVIANLSGAGQAWASLGTIVTFVSGGSFTLGTGVARAFRGIGSEAWSAAKLEARAWNVTWLPTLPQTMTQRARLDSRGVAMPQIRKNLDD